METGDPEALGAMRLAGKHGERAASRDTRLALLGLALLLAILGGLQSACTAYPNPESHSLATVGRAQNPVIFLHGTMGSHLVDRESGRVVWGEFSRKAGNHRLPEAVRGITLPMERGKPLRELRDSTYPSSNLNRVSLSPLPGFRVKLGFYAGAMGRFRDALSAHGTSNLPAGGSYLEFSYDWRRSCDENAAALAKFVQATKADLVKNHGYSRSMKFDFIAHSQGALVLRYYLRYGGRLLPLDGSLPRITWEGASHVENIALLAAPNAGVPITLRHLTYGHRAKPFFPKYEPAMIGTTPSLYQLFPRARDGVLLDPVSKAPLDPLDFDLWVKKEWGLANPEQDDVLRILLPGVASAAERRAIALDHLRKCLANAAQFQAALDRPARQPRHLRVSLFAGDGKKTPLSYLATPRRVTLYRTGKGDVMVPVSSALHAPSDQVKVFPCSHNGLACKRKFNHHVIDLLKEAP